MTADPPEDVPTPPAPAAPFLFACKITKPCTRVGDVVLGAGLVVRLPKDQVDALVEISAATLIGI